MSVKILYNDQDVFGSLGVTPFVSKSQEFIDFGTKWNQITNLDLNGQIISTGTSVGSNASYKFGSTIQSLFNKFSQNYKNISISENGSTLYQGLAVINSISIDENPWYGAIPFNINLSIYEQNLFSDYFGVVEPTENFSFSDEEGEITTFVHTVSAKGFVTQNSNAITNAKTWVNSKKSNFDKFKPILVKNSLGKDFILKSTKETVDRFNGVYTWEATYQKNNHPESPKDAFLNYTVELNYNIDDGLVTAQINGTIENNSINILRNTYNSLNLHSICNDASSQAFSQSLSTKIRSQSLDENSGENKITFSAQFNNDLSNDVIDDNSVDVSVDSLKCIANVTVNGTISCKYGDLKTKWDQVKKYYQGINPYSLASSAFSELGLTPALLSNPISESIEFDEFNAVIRYSATYSNKRVSLNEKILNMSSSVTFNPSLLIHVPNISATTPREHNIQNLQCANRSSVNISVTVVGKQTMDIGEVESSARGEAGRLKSNYVSGGNEVLDSDLTSINENLKTVNIEQTWFFDGETISS